MENNSHCVALEVITYGCGLKKVPTLKSCKIKEV